MIEIGYVLLSPCTFYWSPTGDIGALLDPIHFLLDDLIREKNQNPVKRCRSFIQKNLATQRCFAFLIDMTQLHAAALTNGRRNLYFQISISYVGRSIREFKAL